MSIAYEINRLNRNKQQVKEQVNVDKDIINEGREFIRGETVRHYPSGIKSMEMSYKDFIPVHTSTESLIETERGGTIISKTLKGNTTQNGTPTPSSPVAVNNVTGEQVVRVCGKNIFDKSKVIAGYRFDSVGELYSQTGCNATDFISVTPSTNYNVTWTIVWNEVVCLYDINKTFTRRIVTGLNFTTEANEYFIRVDVTDGHLDTAQIAKGTSEVYEPYQGKDYEVNLGKNLLKLDTVTGTKNGVTYNWEGNKLTLNGTTTAATDIYNFGWWGATTKNNDRYLNPGTYTLSIQGASNVGRFSINTYYETTSVISLSRDNTNASKTLNSGTYYSNCYISILSNQTFNNEVFYIQLEKNNVMSSYSPYFTPIELNKIGDYQDFIRKGTGKNLFNKNAQPYKSNRYIDGSGQEGSSTEFSIFKTYLEPNTTYTITNSGDFGTPGYALYNSSDERVGGSNYLSRSHITFTTTSDTSYILESVVTDTSSTRYDLNIYQIEPGSIATSYEPYNYGDKWYIEKNIGKIIVNGSENCSRQVLSNDIVRFMFTGNVDGIGGARQTIFSNYFVANLNSANDREGIGFVYGNLLYLYKQEASVADFQTWLSTHNTIVYYVLSSPTFETISDSTLISQLNENIYLLEGQNNISVSGNLPTGIDVDYIERVNKHLIGNTNESAE